MPSAKPVFISYAADDWPFASRLAALLSAKGAEVFFDRRAKMGDAWAETVRREVTKAAALILLLPAGHAADRNYVWVEAGAAKALGKRILAVLLPDHRSGDLPNELADVLILDAHRRSLDNIADTLLQAVPEMAPA